MDKKLAVIGAGSWGTALSQVMAGNDYSVSLWARRKELCDEINERHTNGRFIPGIALSAAIRSYNDFHGVLSGQRIVFLVVPSPFMRDTLKSAAPYLEPGAVIVSAIKGIETSTLLRPTEIIRDVLGAEAACAVLSGPSFAREVVSGMPTAVTIAADDIRAARELQFLLNARSLRLYASDDVAGVELGGSLKNVVAIAAGICDGAGIGKSARASIITRGLAEIIRLGMRMGAKRETFSGLSGLGDLVLTATDDQSRNRTVGFRIGRGEDIRQILGGMVMVAEGVQTSLSVKLLADKLDVEMPVSAEIYEIIHRGKDARESIQSLLSRPLKDEHYESYE